MVWLYAAQAMSWFDVKEFAMSNDKQTNENMRQLITDVQMRLFEINMEHRERNEKFLFDTK